MTTRIKLRRDTAANWLDSNPILAAGEPGLETDTGKIKYGDGITPYAELVHAGGDTLTDEGSVQVVTGSTEHWVANQRRDGYDSYPASLRYDSLGNLYTLNYSEDVEGGSIVSITKYTPAGAVAWQKTITDRDPLALAIDSNNRAFIVTQFGPEIQVTKLETTGAILWKQNYAYANGNLYSAYMEEKSNGNMVVAVNFSPSAAPSEVLLLEISGTTGNVVTTKILGRDSENVYAGGIDVVDDDDNIFVTGHYQDTAADKDKMFIEKLDNTLTRVWSKSLTTPDNYNMSAGDCASDVFGNVYAVGFYQVAAVSVNGGETDGSAAVLTKLNSSGVVQWTRRIGPGLCGSIIGGVTVDSNGDIYLVSTTGESNKSPEFQGDDSLAFGYGDIRMIVARYDNAGAVIWQRYANFQHTVEYPSEGGVSIAVFEDKFALAMSGSQSNTTPFLYSGTDDSEDDYFVAQLPTDGTELTIGDLDFTESRIPGRFVTHVTTDISSTNALQPSATVTVTVPTIVFDSEARIANSIVKSDTYTYTFGADGTLTIPNDGDVKLTQTQVGYLIAIGGAANTNDNIWGRAVTVDSQGYMYVSGQNDGNSQPFVTKISPEGNKEWSITIDDDNEGDSGRANGITLNPTTGNVMLVCEFYANYTYSVLFTIDQDTGRILDNQTFYDDTADVYLTDVAYTSTGTAVVVGSKYGEFSPEIPVTTQTGSTTGTIVILRSDVPNNADNWQIGGTGFSVFENVAYVERYTGLAGTVRQGSGATFDIINNGNGTYSAGIVSGGTNYLPGHQIKILGTSLTGAENTSTFTSGVDYIVGDVAGGNGLGPWTVSVDGTYTSITSLITTGTTLTITVASTTISTTVTNVDNQGIITYTVGDLSGFGSNAFNIDSITVSNGTYGTGATPANDIIITVQTVDPGGIITGVGNTGTAAGTFTATATAVSGTNYNVGSGFTVDFECSRYNTDYSNYNNYNITNHGTNYADGDVIVIPGTSLGGTSPANDLTWTAYASGGLVYSNYSLAGTGQSSTWKLETTTQVDFSGEGSWAITYPLSRENFLATPTWQRTFGIGSDNTDRAYALAIDSANNIIVVGQGYGVVDAGNSYNLATVWLYTSTGSDEWVKQLNEQDSDCEAMSVVTIGTDIYTTHHSGYNGDTVITKLDTSGNIKWQRKTDSSDDSVIARTPDGNLLVAVEAYNSDCDEDCIKVFKLTPSGEVVFKRWLSAATDQGTRFKNGRGLVTDATSFYITGYFYANDYDSAFAARLPLDGTGVGEYGSFRYTDVNPMNGSFMENGPNDMNYPVEQVDLTTGFAGDLNAEPHGTTATTVQNASGDFYVNWFGPNWTMVPVRDTDGGRIVFADGTTQNTSATDTPQRRYVGQKYTLGLQDRGHHILCTNSNDEILIPYNARVEFPIGTTITIVNMDYNSVYIYTEGGSTQMMVAGNYNGYTSSAQVFGCGVGTLIKVGREQWVLYGNVDTY